jgi:hypothetical protein
LALTKLRTAAGCWSTRFRFLGQCTLEVIVWPKASGLWCSHVRSRVVHLHLKDVRQRPSVVPDPGHLPGHPHPAVPPAMTKAPSRISSATKTGACVPMEVSWNLKFVASGSSQSGSWTRASAARQALLAGRLERVRDDHLGGAQPVHPGAEPAGNCVGEVQRLHPSPEPGAVSARAGCNVRSHGCFACFDFRICALAGVLECSGAVYPDGEDVVGRDGGAANRRLNLPGAAIWVGAKSQVPPSREPLCAARSPPG